MLDALIPVELSTHKDGGPSRKTWIRIASVFAIGIIIIFYMFFIGLFSKIFGDWGLLYLVLIIIIFLTLSTVYAAYLWIPKAVTANQAGVSYRKLTSKFIYWNDVREVRSEQVISHVGRHHVRMIPGVSIRSESLKISANAHDFEEEGLRSLFNYALAMTRGQPIKLKDELNWVPDYKVVRSEESERKIVQSKKFYLAGIVMMILGMAFAFLIFYNEMFMWVGILLLFIGFGVTMAGSYVAHEEKAKKELK